MLEYDYLKNDLGAQALDSYRPPPRFKYPSRASDFIPVVVTGGVGDLIVALNAIDQLEKIAPVRVWTSHPEVYTFFKGKTGLMTTPFLGFDYWISLNSVVKIHFEDNFTSFPFAELDEIYMCQQSFARAKEWENIINHHPNLDHFLGLKAIERGYNRFTLPLTMMGLDPEYRFKQYTWGSAPSSFDLEPYITLHDGFELNQGSTAFRSTKNWSLREWTLLVEKIKAEYPGINILQLGSSTSRPIPGVHYNLIGRTTISACFELLSKSLMHIDGDSGLVHAARAMGVRSIVMFGPTPLRFFGYPENINLAPEIPCAGCWWVKKDWLARCALKKPGVPCMDSIKAETVFEKLRAHLSDGRMMGYVDCR